MFREIIGSSNGKLCTFDWKTNEHKWLLKNEIFGRSRSTRFKAQSIHIILKHVIFLLFIALFIIKIYIFIILLHCFYNSSSVAFFSYDFFSFHEKILLEDKSCVEI